MGPLGHVRGVGTTPNSTYFNILYLVLLFHPSVRLCIQFTSGNIFLLFFWFVNPARSIIQKEKREVGSGKRKSLFPLSPPTKRGTRDGPLENRGRWGRRLNLLSIMPQGSNDLSRTPPARHTAEEKTQTTKGHPKKGTTALPPQKKWKCHLFHPSLLCYKIFLC